jgi:hypothetical protein
VQRTGLENRDYGRGDPLRWPRNILYPQKLAQASPTSGGRSVGIRSRTQVTEFICLWVQKGAFKTYVSTKVQQFQETCENKFKVHIPADKVE